MRCDARESLQFRRVTGWLGDFFRFWWALFYWNTRKTWFRLRGAHRDDCPCQNYSDSGHALDSRCDAVVHWQKPARFRRVCPLLAATPNGWRCSADAERVRPFWGRAGAYLAGALLGCYLLGTIGVYTALRLARYETSYLAVVWPGRWGELRNSQEKLYAARAQKALQAGNYQEAILSLEMVTKLNPRNYAAGLALAGLSQVAAQPHVADHIYERLMHDVPEQRIQTAQIWFRLLLARGAYGKVKPLAAAMMNEDPGDRAAWLHALLFSARRTDDGAYLGDVLAAQPHLPGWCVEIIGTEQQLLQKHPALALPRLLRVHRQPASPYLPYYQIDRLLRHGYVDQANAVLDNYRGALRPDEATFLRLRVYQAKGWTSLVDPELDSLLRYEMSPRIIGQFCSYLIKYPNPAFFAHYHDRFVAAALPVNADTISLYQASYLAAILSGNTARAEKIAGRITQYTASNARVLRGLGELLKGPADHDRLIRILPLVPLPTEVLYAVLDRPGTPPASK